MVGHGWSLVSQQLDLSFVCVDLDLRNDVKGLGSEGDSAGWSRCHRRNRATNNCWPPYRVYNHGLTAMCSEALAQKQLLSICRSPKLINSHGSIDLTPSQGHGTQNGCTEMGAHEGTRTGGRSISLPPAGSFKRTKCCRIKEDLCLLS